MHDWEIDLTIRCEKQAAPLAICDGTVSVTDPLGSGHTVSGDQEITRLLFGFKRPEYIIGVSEVSCDGDGRDLAIALSPEKKPHMLNQDC